MINNRISSGQFAAVAFLSFLSPIAFIRSNDLNNNIADTVFSVLLAFVLGIILSLPMLITKKNNIFEREGNALTKLINIAYILYFAFIIITDTEIVTKMLTNTIIAEGNDAFIAFFMLAVALYGAFKGTETLARSADVILFFFVISVLFLIIAATQNIKTEEYIVPFIGGYSDFTENTLLILSFSAFIPQLFMLTGNVKGKIGGKYIAYLLIAAVIGAVLFLEVQYTMGYYALTQKYPLYTLSAVTKAEPLKRLDLFFIGVFIMTSILRIALSFLSLFEALNKISVKREKSFKYILAFIVTLTSVIFIMNEGIISVKLLSDIRLILLMVFSALFPLLLIIAGRRKGAKTK